MFEILESDDELPDSYNDNFDIPAYQDDHRFDRLEQPNEFMWLHKKLDDLNRTSAQSEHPKQKLGQDKPHANSKPKNKKQQLQLEEICAIKQSEHIIEQEPCTPDEILPNQQNFSSKKPDVTNKITLEQNQEDKTHEKKIRISKGILTKRDIFFIKSIEEYLTDSTLLWFIDFLRSKEQNPLQRSCLVSDITRDHYINMIAKEPLADFNKRYTFKLIIN